MKRKNILIGILLLVLIGVSVKTLVNETSLSKKEAELDKYNAELEFYRLKSMADSLLNCDEFETALVICQQIDSLAENDVYASYAKEIYEERNRLNEDYSSLFNDLNKRSRQIKKLSHNKKELNDSLRNIRNTLGVLQNEFDSILVYNSNIMHRINQLSDSISAIPTNDTLTIVTNDGVSIKYLGETKEGIAQGYGYAIFDNKSYYEGEWENNLRSGYGKYYWQNGDFYDGEYIKDLRSGFGTYHFESGERYIGHWKNDLRHGKGVLLDKEGKQLYKGMWQNNKPIKKG